MLGGACREMTAVLPKSGDEEPSGVGVGDSGAAFSGHVSHSQPSPNCCAISPAHSKEVKSNQFVMAQAIVHRFFDSSVHTGLYKKVSARLCELAPNLGASSLNPADTFLNNPVYACATQHH